MSSSSRRCIQSVCLSVAFVLLSFSVSSGSEADAFFIKGNEHYQDGDYEAAIAEYQKIRELGFESWEVYYNLGNAYYKQGNIAHAILNFERALKANRKNEDLNFNLELANLSVVDRIPALPKFFLFRWIESAARVMNPSTLAIVALICYLVIMTLVTARLFFNRGGLRGASSVVIVLGSIVLVAFSGLLAVVVYDNETKEEAVVMRDRVDVVSAPGDSGTEVFALHAGVKVQVQDTSGEWVKIRLSDGKLGWLRSETLQHI